MINLADTISMLPCMLGNKSNVTPWEQCYPSGLHMHLFTHVYMQSILAFAYYYAILLFGFHLKSDGSIWTTFSVHLMAWSKSTIGAHVHREVPEILLGSFLYLHI